MKTSNFAYWARYKFPEAISISRYPDRRSGWNGAEFPPLMPSAQLLKMYKEDGLPWEAYRAIYETQNLGLLNPQKTYDMLVELVGGHEPILLCYESSKTLDTTPCHRRLVAEWFERELGIEVPEWAP